VPGCLILAAIVTIFGGLIVLYIVVGTYQYRKIGTFTQETAAELAIPAPSAAQVEAAMGKLKAVEAAVAAKKSERILFSSEDLNVLLATLPAAEGFRGNTRIERIGSTGIVAAMAQPLRKAPFQKGFRYLNASFLLEPELRARTIAFKVIEIRPSFGEVPDAFVDSYASLDLFKLDPENPAMKAHVASLAAVYTEEGQLVVETGLGPRGKE
jgi:hypothetical protein